MTAGTWLRSITRHHGGTIGAVILLTIAAIAVLAPVLFPADPFDLVGTPNEPPTLDHLFGTDPLGRDIATAMAYGARTSLVIGLASALGVTMVGVTVGATSGFYGGVADRVLMRITEVFQTVPPFLFAIVMVTILGPSIRNLVLSIVLVSWPSMARLVRAETISLKQRDFVQAGICMGMSHARLLITQILPSCLPSIIVTASIFVASAILLESAMSFLGLGDPNAMSWGFLIGAGRSELRTAWWVCAIPGLAILITVLSIALLGEALNDALNPRLSRR